MMDDFSIVDRRLTDALDNLQGVNRFLGGYHAVRSVWSRGLSTWRSGPVRVLDLATGLGDYPVDLVRWAHRHGITVDVLGLDANPETVRYARASVDRLLSADLRARVRIEEGDALRLPYAAGSFDVCMASHFLHHLDHPEAVALLGIMQRTARRGVLINDLHRHPLAYYGIRTIGALLPVSPMFAHDGPISVLRGFSRADLLRLATDAGLERASIRWHWAFRWTLDTLPSDASGRQP